MTTQPEKQSTPEAGISKPDMIGHDIIFTVALEKQLTLSTRQFDTLGEAWDASASACEVLNDELERRGYDAELATLHGDEIVVPVVTFDEKIGSYDIHTLRLRDATSDDPTKQATSTTSIKGTFAGFYQSAILNPDEGTYSALINYRVVLNPMTDRPHFSGPLFATAPVFGTEVVFEADQQKIDERRSLAVLAEIDDPHTAAIIARLDDLLGGDDRYSAKNLTAVSVLIRRHKKVSSVFDDNRYEDALVDFVTSRLALYPGASFLLTANSSAVKRSDQTIAIGGTVNANLVVEGVGLGPYFYKKPDQTWAYEDKGSISVVIQKVMPDGDIALSTIPFERLQSIQPSFTSTDLTIT